MKEFAEEFYSSKAWKECRKAYKKSVGGLCERCLGDGRYSAGVIVHHKVHVTPETITRPDVLLSFDNLELLCRDCHAAAHDNRQRRYRVDELGRVISRGS